MNMDFCMELLGYAVSLLTLALTLFIIVEILETEKSISKGDREPWEIN